MKAIVFICLLIFSQSHCVEDVTESSAIQSTSETPEGEDIFEIVYNMVMTCSEKGDLLLTSNCIVDALLEHGERFLDLNVKPYVSQVQEHAIHHVGTAVNITKCLGEILDVVKQNLPEYVDIIFDFAKDTAKEHLQNVSHKMLFQLLSHFGLASSRIPVE